MNKYLHDIKVYVESQEKESSDNSNSLISKVNKNSLILVIL